MVPAVFTPFQDFCDQCMKIIATGLCKITQSTLETRGMKTRVMCFRIIKSSYVRSFQLFITM
jgi:hypothetical protein